MIEFEVEDTQENAGARLKVIGVGGAGGNAVNSMIASNELESVEFVVANTDLQSLNLSSAQHKIQLGSKITKGLGAGSNPDIGRRAAEEDLEAIVERIADAEILFLTAGLGGGTGSGALPVIAGAAREKGVLSVAIVSSPFAFEGRRRMKQAQDAMDNLKGIVDTLIVVPNQRLLEIVDPKISMLDAFAMANDILKQAIKGISDIITKAGHINVDFADVYSIMKDMGRAMMGTGYASGEDRARKAALNAINSPLLEGVSIQGARGILINITGNNDLGLHEINEAASVVYDLVSEDADIILGSVIDANMGDEIKVTVIATGLDLEDSKSKDKGESIGAARHEFIAELDSLKRKESVVGDKFEDVQLEVASKDDNINRREIEKPDVFAPGASDETFDMSDMDTPTFLRKNNEQEKEDRTQ